MEMPTCPYCRNELKIHDNVTSSVLRNQYDTNIVTKCCGRMVEVFAIVTIGVRKSNAEEDQWGAKEDQSNAEEDQWGAKED